MLAPIALWAGLCLNSVADAYVVRRLQPLTAALLRYRLEPLSRADVPGKDALCPCTHRSSSPMAWSMPFKVRGYMRFSMISWTIFKDGVLSQ